MTKWTEDDLVDAQTEIDNLNDVIDDLENLETGLGEKAGMTAKWCQNKAAYYHSVANFIEGKIAQARIELDQAKEGFAEIEEALPEPNDEHRLSRQQMGL